MSTYDFVKKTGRDKYWELMEKEKKMMLDPKTGRLKKSLEKHVKCPVCEIDDTSFAFEKDGFSYVRCNECGMLYTNPQLNESKIRSQYRSIPSQNYWVDVLQTPPQLKYDTKKFRDALEDISTFADPGRLLDIGCSLGIFLDLARKKGWEVHGVELNERARLVAEQKFRIKPYDKPLEDLDLEPGSFDVITLWEVLEHLTDPRRILNQAHRLLKPGGMLVVLVPNCDSFAVRVMHGKAATFGWAHLWYFTPASLETLLEQCGYTVFKTGTELGEMDTLTNYLQFDPPYIGKNVKRRYRSPYLLSDAMKKQLAEFICRSNLGYKLRMYARKKK